jgi:hypothetical protein
MRRDMLRRGISRNSIPRKYMLRRDMPKRNMLRRNRLARNREKEIATQFKIRSRYLHGRAEETHERWGGRCEDQDLNLAVLDYTADTRYQIHCHSTLHISVPLACY